MNSSRCRGHWFPKLGAEEVLTVSFTWAFLVRQPGPKVLWSSGAATELGYLERNARIGRFLGAFQNSQVGWLAWPPFGAQPYQLSLGLQSPSWRCARSCTFSNSFVSSALLWFGVYILGFQFSAATGDRRRRPPLPWAVVRSPSLSDMVCISDSTVRCSPSSPPDSRTHTNAHWRFSTKSYH